MFNIIKTAKEASFSIKLITGTYCGHGLPSAEFLTNRLNDLSQEDSFEIEFEAVSLAGALVELDIGVTPDQDKKEIHILFPSNASDDMLSVMLQAIRLANKELGYPHSSTEVVLSEADVCEKEDGPTKEPGFFTKVLSRTKGKLFSDKKGDNKPLVIAENPESGKKGVTLDFKQLIKTTAQPFRSVGRMLNQVWFNHIAPMLRSLAYDAEGNRRLPMLYDAVAWIANVLFTGAMILMFSIAALAFLAMFVVASVVMVMVETMRALYTVLTRPKEGGVPATA